MNAHSTLISNFKTLLEKFNRVLKYNFIVEYQLFITLLSFFAYIISFFVYLHRFWLFVVISLTCEYFVGLDCIISMNCLKSDNNKPLNNNLHLSCIPSSCTSGHNFRMAQCMEKVISRLNLVLILLKKKKKIKLIYKSKSPFYTIYLYVNSDVQNYNKLLSFANIFP